MSHTPNFLANLIPTDLDAGTVFSGSPSGTLVKGYAEASSFTPKVNPAYIFHEHSRDLVVWFIAPPTPLYVCGPTGAGKSSGICQLAARLNYPVFEVTGYNHLEFQDLVGHHTIQNGNMTFAYGPLALAMRHGGLCLLNELDLLEPSTATGLNGILDGQPLCIPENNGELIHPHPMFRFAATANTARERHAKEHDKNAFQSTLPRGSDLAQKFKPGTRNLFQSTLPRGSDACCYLAGVIYGGFNPRSREGATRTALVLVSKSQAFQSTLPRGSDDILPEQDIQSIKVSIHAPARERLARAFLGGDFFRSFNPRSREGATINTTSRGGML